MAEGYKTGGRQKGTPNKKTQLIQDKAKELGCDPMEILMLFALGDSQKLNLKTKKITKDKDGLIKEVDEFDKIPADQRLKAAAELAEYLYPKRKAIEHTGEEGRPIEVEITPDGLIDLVNKARGK